MVADPSSWREADVDVDHLAYGHGLRDRKLSFLNPPPRTQRVAYASYCAAWFLLSQPAPASRKKPQPPCDAPATAPTRVPRS